MVSSIREFFSTTWHRSATLVDVLQFHLQKQADGIGFYFLQPDQSTLELSYGDLDRQAKAIAVYLLSKMSPGERVLLMYPPGLELIAGIMGCMYAGAVAVPVYPPRRNRNLTRLLAVAGDAQASVILTTASLEASLRIDEEKNLLGNLPVIASDRIVRIFGELADDWQNPGINSDTMAMLQYTSGSTGQPKGVMLTHANLLHNLEQIYQRFGHHENSRVVSWLPPYHDMGLIGGTFQPLYGGFPVTLMSPVSFLQKPIRWLQAISQTRATTSGAPNFAYEMCLHIALDECKNLDLSSWELAFTGAEPIRADTLEQFAIKFAPYGFRKSAFYACYGLAEATLFVTGGEKGRKTGVKNLSVQNYLNSQNQNHQNNSNNPNNPNKTLVSCGTPGGEQTVIIVNPDTQEKCADGEEGEIWIAGESVALGYWNRPLETEATFQAVLASGSQQKFLRTGDLGIYEDGELWVTGRIKDIIVIRGCNYYPQDIEITTAQSHPSLSNTWGAALSVEEDGEEKLVIVWEVERHSWRNLDPNEINLAICAAISHAHGLQVHGICLLKPSSIPKTSSGKVQRYACKAGFLDCSLDVISRWVSRESQQVGLGISPQSVQVINPDIKNDIKNKNINQNMNEDGDINLEKSDACLCDDDNLNSVDFHPFPNLETCLCDDDNLNSVDFHPFPNPETCSCDHDNSSLVADRLIDWLRDYATYHINSQIIDERRCIPPHIVLDLGNRGLLGMQVPQSYGGLDLGHRDTLRILQQLGAIDTTLALFVGLNNILGIRPILRYGCESTKAELLPLLATGRELAAFALTEPGAGSHPQAIASVAIPTATAWKLRGKKIWSGSAAWSGVINVFVREPERGITGFVVRRGTPGLRQGGEALTMGMRGMVQNTVYLHDVPVTQEQLLGEIGAGINVAQDAMMYGRLAIAAACVGGMKRCVQLMWRYSSRRQIATGKLHEHPVVLSNFQEITNAITVVENLVNKVAELLDRGVDLPIEVYTACKITAPEFYWQAADLLMQTLGGRGYIETNIAPQILRDARILRIFEGPTETLCGFLGARVCKHKRTLMNFLTDVFAAGEIVGKLENAIAQIQERFLSGSSSQNVAIERWIYHQLGELVSEGILWGAMVSQNNLGNQQVITWIENRFDRKIEQIFSFTDANSPLTKLLTNNGASSYISQSIHQYIRDIGDIEQSLPGEERELDDLLRKSISDSPPEAVSRFTNHQGNTLSSSPQIQSKSVSSSSPKIQSWLTNWLHQKLDIPLPEISVNQAFASYGIDSVMAVELAQDLQEWLEQECLDKSQQIEPTIAWNFPTIAELADYLSQNQHNSQPHPENSHPQPADNNTLEELSTTEMAVLLAQEIAIAKQRRKS